MAIPKYRPTLTMNEIESLIEAAACYTTTCSHTQATLSSALRVLKVFKLKADMGVNAPASITTGKKPGPVSAADIVKSDYEQSLKTMPYAQAISAAQTYKTLGIEVPAHIQAILEAGEE